MPVKREILLYCVEAGGFSRFCYVYTIDIFHLSTNPAWLPPQRDVVCCLLVADFVGATTIDTRICCMCVTGAQS